MCNQNGEDHTKHSEKCILSIIRIARNALKIQVCIYHRYSIEHPEIGTKHPKTEDVRLAAEKSANFSTKNPEVFIIFYPVYCLLS